MRLSEWCKKLILSGLGTGYLPVAPGTWGSAVIALLYLLIGWRCPGRWEYLSAAMLLIALAASVGCVALGPYAERTFGRKDPRYCTLDEWAGQAVSYLLLPPFLMAVPVGKMWVPAVAGFVAFRIFDVIKLSPARRLEKLPHGWGVLLDDIAAGVYANVLCQVVLRTGWVAWAG